MHFTLSACWQRNSQLEMKSDALKLRDYCTASMRQRAVPAAKQLRIRLSNSRLVAAIMPTMYMHMGYADVL